VVRDALDRAGSSLRDAGFEVDYVALVDADTLEPLDAPQGKMRLIAAATIGTTRLIDNRSVWTWLSGINHLLLIARPNSPRNRGEFTWVPSVRKGRSS
jgi:hypothetical protein